VTYKKDRSQRLLLLLLLVVVVVFLRLRGDSEINAAIVTRLVFINCAARRTPLARCC